MTHPPPLDWEALHAVQAVARTRTIRSAALLLAVHHTTVARRIEGLEATLGTRLFERTPDGFVLTVAGEAFAAAGRTFDEMVEAARRSAEGDERLLAGTVSLTMPEPLAIALFVDRLPAFQRAHPDLDLHFLPTYDLLDLERHQADVAVRLDNNPPDRLVGKRLFPYGQTIYASRAWAEGTDPAPRALLPWLGWEAADRTQAPWIAQTEFDDTPVHGIYPSLPLQQAACRAGLGLAMLPCLLGDADPGLVRVTSRPPTPSRDIWVLTPPDLKRTARVRAVRTFVERVLRDARARIVG